MDTRHGMHGFTTTELVLVLLILFILLGIFWPIGVRFRERLPQTACLNQLRQLAIAVQMYEQDNNGSFPDLHWASEITGFLDNNKLFHCPSDTSSEPMISYGYSGLLIHADGSGVNDKDIVAPSEVGMLCDAGPSRSFPDGGIIGGGGLQPDITFAITPMPRHKGGTVAGYADGHAVFIPSSYNAKDITHGVTRAFSMAGALGFVDNPAGGISAFSASATSPASVTVGGEPCTRAILLAAAGVWHVRAKAAIVQHGFHGQYAVQQHGASYLWGTGDGQPPARHAVPIARDLVVVITAKISHIQCDLFHLDPDTANPVSVWDIAMVRKAFNLGFQPNVIQAYTFDNNSGTRRFFTMHLGTPGQPLQFGARTITVKDDYAMVNKVAADPYGIGYCSSAIADPNRVQIIGLRTPDGKVHLFPQDDPKARWIMPATPPDWPLTRTLYAECGGKAWRSDGTGIANVMLAPGAPGTKALRAGPLFRASYWKP